MAETTINIARFLVSFYTQINRLWNDVQPEVPRDKLGFKRMKVG